MGAALRPGDRVRVVGGRFAEFAGTVERVDAPRGVALVRVAAFGREHRVEVEFLDLERAQNEEGR